MSDGSANSAQNWTARIVETSLCSRELALTVDQTGLKPAWVNDGQLLNILRVASVVRGEHPDVDDIHPFITDRLGPRGLDPLVGAAPIFDEATVSAVVDDIRRAAVVRDARVALTRGQYGEAGRLLLEADASGERKPRLERGSTDVIFAPLPPMRWVSPGLLIGPGRPTLLSAYGASGKTLAVQSAALCAAAGRPIWDHYSVPRPMRVMHIDWEQGRRDTYRRYQRLAIGHGIEPSDIGDRLHVASMPRYYLTDPDAESVLAAETTGYDLVVLDSLRAACPDVDENTSVIRKYLDMMSRVSDASGTAFLVIHHGGKPREGQASHHTSVRGSAGIFDACGTIMSIASRKEGETTRPIKLEKLSTATEGEQAQDFGIRIEDVAVGHDHAAGVRVVRTALETSDPDAAAEKRERGERERILTAVRETPGAATAVISHKSHMMKSRAVALLAVLAHEGQVRVVPGPHGAKNYWPVSS